MRLRAVIFCVLFFLSSSATWAEEASDCFCGEGGLHYATLDPEGADLMMYRAWSVVATEPVYDIRQEHEPIVSCLITVELHEVDNPDSDEPWQTIIYGGVRWPLSEFEELMLAEGCAEPSA